MPRKIKKNEYNLTGSFRGTGGDFYSLYTAARTSLWAEMKSSPVDLSPNALTVVYAGSPTAGVKKILSTGDSQRYTATFSESSSQNAQVVASSVLSHSSLASGGTPTSTSDRAFSVSMWINFDDLANTSNQYLFAKGSSSADYEYYGRWTDTRGDFTFLIRDDVGAGSAAIQYVRTPVLTTAEANAKSGSWHHYLFTYDGRGGTSANAGMKIYIDGEDVTATTGSTGTYVGMQPQHGTRLYIGASYAGTSELDGQMAEFAMWNNRVLTQAEMTAIYTRTRRGTSMSGFLNNPPRTVLHHRDNATGSYPTQARTTGFINTTGVYSSSFNDRDTVIFATDFARVNLVVVSARSPDNANGDGRGHWPSSLITLTDGAGTVHSLEFNITGDGDATGGASRSSYIPVKWNTSFTSQPGKQFSWEESVILSTATNIAKAINKANIPMAAFANGNTVTVTQRIAGTAGNQSARSSAGNVKVYNMLMSGTNTFTGSISPGPNGYSGENSVSYPTLLQPEYIGMLTDSGRMPAGMIATPNVNSDITTTAVVRKGIADANLEFTKGQNVSPFDEARVPAKGFMMSYELQKFYESGTPESITPGFSAPLWDKTQIAVETSPSAHTNIFWSTGSNTGPTRGPNSFQGLGSPLPLVYATVLFTETGAYGIWSKIDAVGASVTFAYKAAPVDVVETYNAAAAADSTATPPEFKFSSGDFEATILSLVTVINAVSDGFWAELASDGESFRLINVEERGLSGWGWRVSFNPNVGSDAVWGGYTEHNFEIISPINSGLAYYNFSRNMWEVIGDLTTGSNVDFMDKNMTGSYLTAYPAAHFADNYYTAQDADASTGVGIGQPCDIAGFPNASKFDATGSQLLDMSKYLTAPFLLEKILVEVSGAWGMIPALNKTNNGAKPGSYPQNPTVSFMLLNQYGNQLNTSYVLETEFQVGDDKTGVTKGEVTFPITKEKDVIAFGRVGAWCEYDDGLSDSKAFDSIEQFQSFKPLQFKSSDVWLKNTGEPAAKPFPLSDPWAPWSFYQAAPTGSIQVPFACAQTPAAPSAYPGTYALRTSPPGPGSPSPVINGFVLGNRIGGRNLFALADGRSFRGSTTGATLMAKDSIALGSPTTPLNSWNAYELDPSVSGYLIKPTDKLVFACSYQTLPTARTGSSVMNMNEVGIADSRVQLSSGAGKIILYGSLVKDNKEYHEGLNQFLTSDALHEALTDGPVLDQFDVDPRASFTGNYTDNIVSGSDTVNDAFVLSLQGNVRIPGSAITGSMDSLGLPRKVVGSMTTGVKTVGECAHIVLAAEAAGIPANWTTQTLILTDAMENTVTFTGLASAGVAEPARVDSTNYTVGTDPADFGGVDDLADRRLMQKSIKAGVDLARVNGDLYMETQSSGGGGAAGALLQLSQLFTGSVGNTTPTGTLLSSTYFTVVSGSSFTNGRDITVRSMLARGVRHLDEKERFFDSMMAHPLEYHQADGCGLISYGNLTAGGMIVGADGTSDARKRSVIYLVTRAEFNDAPDEAAGFIYRDFLNYKWAFSFPYESAYKDLERRSSVSAKYPNLVSAVDITSVGGALTYASSSALYNLLLVDGRKLELCQQSGSKDGNLWVPTSAQNLPTLTSFPPPFTSLMQVFFGFGDNPQQSNFPFLNHNKQQVSGSSIVGVNATSQREMAIRGWKYGMINALPQNSSAVFRRDRYGQYRDMLEQRYDAVYHLGTEIGEKPVSCLFRDRQSGNPAKPIDTHCQNLSRFMTSSVPFFDAYRVRTGPSATDFSVGGLWTYGRDREDDPDLRQEVEITFT